MNSFKISDFLFNSNSETEIGLLDSKLNKLFK